MLKKIWVISSLILTTPAMATQISVGFSPSGQALKAVLSTIASAKKSIDLAAYNFTSHDVAQALVSAANRGVQIRVLADMKDNKNSKYSSVITMRQHNIPVRLDGHYAIMHDKFMVVDGVTTETGSFNYTSSADKRNAENALVIWDQPQLAGTYEQEFKRLWNESELDKTNIPDAPDTSSSGVFHSLSKLIFSPSPIKTSAHRYYRANQHRKHKQIQ